MINMACRFKLLNKVELQKNLLSGRIVSCSQDDRWCVIVEDGLYVLQLYGFMDNPLSAISLRKTFVTLPILTNSTTNLNSLATFKNNGVIESEKVDDQYIRVEWSPSGVVDNSQCVLAGLTIKGFLFIFMNTLNEVELNEYILFCNITDSVRNYFQVTEEPWSITSTCFTWSNLFKCEKGNFCILFVSNSNGYITYWKFDKRHENDVNQDGVNCLGHFLINENVNSLRWQKTELGGVLFIGTIKSTIETAVFSISADKLKLENVTQLWKAQDNIKITEIKTITFNGMLIMAAVRESILLIYIFSKGLVTNIQKIEFNESIIAMEQFSQHSLLLCFKTGILKQLSVISKDDKFVMQAVTVECDCSTLDYATQGLIISKNAVFVGVFISEAKLPQKKHRDNSYKLLIYTNLDVEPLDVLMKNNSKTIGNFWDCFEILRLKGITMKTLTTLGLPKNLIYDKLDVNKLRTLVWLMKATETICDKLPTIADISVLPSKDLIVILKIKLCLQHTSVLLNIYLKQGELSNFNLHSLYISNLFLKDAIKEDILIKFGLGENTLNHLLGVIKALKQLIYPKIPKCLWCKKEFIHLFCNPSHVDTKCCISFMQIKDLPYYKCQFCSCVVHQELTNVYYPLLCFYCGVPLRLVSHLKGDNKIKYISKRITKNTEETTEGDENQDGG